MVGSLVSNKDFVIACRSRTYRGLKISLLEYVVIGCPRAIGCVMGIDIGDVLTWVGSTSESLVLEEDKGSGCVSEGNTSVVGESCEKGRGAIKGVRSY